jgi:hypothetical protein
MDDLEPGALATRDWRDANCFGIAIGSQPHLCALGWCSQAMDQSHRNEQKERREDKLCTFTAAYATLAGLAALGILPRLLLWSIVVWALHVAWPRALQR